MDPVSLLVAVLVFALIIWIAQSFLPAPISTIVVVVTAVVAIIYLLRYVL